jgi:hypothetical protein
MWPRERLTPEPGARLTLSPNWRFHSLCSVQRSELALCFLDLFIRIVNRLYLPVIFQDASEPVGPNRLGPAPSASHGCRRHSRRAALWALSGLVSGRTQPNGMNLPITPFQVSRSRGGRYACRQSSVFLCIEPSLLEHNGAIVTSCFSQRYRFQAVVKRSSSKNPN